MFSPVVLVFLVVLIFGFTEGLGILLAYAVFGSFILGIGLASCVAAKYNKEFFWRWGIYPIAIGAVIVVGNVICAHSERIAQVLTEDLLSFQLFCYIGVFWSMLLYYVARDAMEDHLARKTRLTKKQIDDRKNGFFNILWYREIHKEYGIGWMYYFIVFYTTVLMLLLIGTAALVLHRIAIQIVMPLCLVTAIGSIILELFVFAVGRKNKKSYHKTNKKRLLAKIPGYYEIAIIAVVVVLTYWQMRFYLDLVGCWS